LPNPLTCAIRLKEKTPEKQQTQQKSQRINNDFNDTHKIFPSASMRVVKKDNEQSVILV